MPKFKIGDIIKIREDIADREFGSPGVTYEMRYKAGHVYRITEFAPNRLWYKVNESGNRWNWSDEMIVPSSEEEYRECRKKRRELLQKAKILVYSEGSRIKFSKEWRIEGDKIYTDSPDPIDIMSILNVTSQKVKLTTDVFPYGKVGDIIEAYFYMNSAFVLPVSPFNGDLYLEEYKIIKEK